MALVPSPFYPFAKKPHMTSYRVSKYGSVLVGEKLLRSGTKIRDDMFQAANLKDMLRSGHIVIEGAPDYGVDPSVVPIKTDIDLSKKSEKELEVRSEDTSEREEQIKKIQHTGPWNRDPDKLKDMTLEELNTIVIETDHEVTPFKTKKEATIWLSQDFIS